MENDNVIDPGRGEGTHPIMLAKAPPYNDNKGIILG